MMIRAGFFLLAIVSALKIRQIIANSSRKQSNSQDEEASSQQEEIEEKNNGKFSESKIKPSEEDEKKIKTCRSVSAEQHNVTSKQYGESNLLNMVVKEKQNETANLDVRFLELYCLKEQQSRISLLQNQLINKISEIDRLRGKIDELKADKEKFLEELKLNQLVDKQFESENATILELLAKRERGTKQIEVQLVQLKEQISGIRKQEERERFSFKVDKKLKALKDEEMKAKNMKRRNIELQLDKRELIVKLNSAKAKMAELSCFTEHKIVSKFQEEISRLTHKNDDLAEEIDRLQRDRFGFVEELVYHRWLNKCLRFELEDNRSPQPEKIKPTESENNRLNFWSSSNSSEMSSIDSSDELNYNSTISSSSGVHVKEKKPSLLRTIKRWTRRKDNSNGNASESKSKQGKPRLIRRFSTSSIPNSMLGLRSRAGDNGTLFLSKNDGKMDHNSPEKPATPRVRRVSFNDSINSIRYIYEDRPESDQETSDSSQEINSESLSDSSAMETRSGTDAEPVNMDHELSLSTANTMSEENKADIPSSTIIAQIQESTSEPKQQGLDTEICQMEETIMNSGMPDEASEVSKFCNLLVNLTAGVLILVLFLVLIYFQICLSF